MSKEKEVEEITSENLNEKLTEADAELSAQLRETLLEDAYRRVRQLEEINKRLQDQILDLRDEIALDCYVSLIHEVSDADKAAEDAYRLADIFLRIREGDKTNLELKDKENASESV